MQDYQRAFIALAVERGALRFGEFTLKSGRVSPYFFNAGLLNTGRDLSQTGDAFAAALTDRGLTIDTLFGPAYKGIPLASATSIALYRNHGIDVPWAFNRKEAKDHGEGGMLVGAPVQGDTVVIDDVITAGTAIREIMALLDSLPDARPGGIAVALDRQERGQGERSAIQEIEADYGVPVVAIITLDDLLQYLRESPDAGRHLDAVAAYRDRYGV